MEVKNIVMRSMPIVLILVLIFLLSIYLFPEFGERLRIFSPLGVSLPEPLVDFAEAAEEGSNFKCSRTSNGYECGIDFINNLNENVKVVFFFSDDKGRNVDTVVALARGSSGRVATTFICESGSYRVSWTAFRESDTSYHDPLAGSISMVSFNCD